MNIIDTTDIFARLLIGELTYYIGRKENLNYKPNTWIDLSKEMDDKVNELKENGLFFHKGGSVFTDYKILKSTVFPIGEGEMSKIANQFSSQMGKDELLSKARQIVEEWKSSSGQEKKR